MILKKILSPVSDALDRVCSVLIVVMLGLMVVITTAQIVCRTFFTSLSWSDEVTRYLLIWSTFLGATCVYRHGGNIAITFIQDMVPKKLGSVMRIAVHAICCALFAVLLFYSCRRHFLSQISPRSLPPALQNHLTFLSLLKNGFRH